jgi:hypothetical protein
MIRTRIKVQERKGIKPLSQYSPLPYNDAREINTSRGEAMQLIAHLAKTIETMIS